MTRLRWPAAVLALTALAAPLNAEIVEQVLVKVNGEIVTLSEFEKRQVAALRERPELARVPANSPELARAIAETAPRLILSAVDELLWLQRARELGWALTDDRYNQILGDIRRSNNLEDEAAFKAALAAEGMTERELRTSIERNALITQLQRQEVLEKINVSEAELRQFYENNRGQFTTPAQVTLREILIPVPTTERGVNVAESDAARARAEEVRKRLLAGEPFPRLAAEVSAAPTKATGGLMDPIRLDDLAPTFQEILGAMKVGDITEVVPTTAGFHILKLEARSETRIQSLEDARDAVVRRVTEQKAEAELLRHLEQLRSQATITWRHEELRKAYEQALTERRASLGLSVPAAQAAPPGQASARP